MDRAKQKPHLYDEGYDPGYDRVARPQDGRERVLVATVEGSRAKAVLPVAMLGDANVREFVRALLHLRDDQVLVVREEVRP